MSLKPILARVANGERLAESEAETAFGIIMAGEATPAQIAGLLMAMRVRGETVAEMTGAVRAMRARMLAIEAPAEAMDIVGTGGDAAGTLNISTAAAFVVAGCGVPVAKHGNRALSSRSGAADAIAALGVSLETPIELLSGVLRAASVFGQTFLRGGLAAVLRDARPAALATVLADLCTREVLATRPETSGASGATEYVFCHALLREAAYAALTDADRCRANRRAGAWLETGGAPEPMALAEHFDLVLKLGDRVFQRRLLGFHLGDGLSLRGLQLLHVAGDLLLLRQRVLAKFVELHLFGGKILLGLVQLRLKRLDLRLFLGLHCQQPFVQFLDLLLGVGLVLTEHPVLDEDVVEHRPVVATGLVHVGAVAL